MRSGAPALNASGRYRRNSRGRPPIMPELRDSFPVRCRPAACENGVSNAAVTKPINQGAALVIAFYLLGNFEKKFQIATGESKSSPFSGMACPPFCTEYKTTTGTLSLDQVMLETEVGPPR